MKGISCFVAAVAAACVVPIASADRMVSVGYRTPAALQGLHVVSRIAALRAQKEKQGLRISVASLPIVEYIFQWKGIGYVALQSIASRDAAALTASALVLVTLFALLSFIADVGRPRFAYR